MPNVNETTGIRYGIIAANSLESDLVSDLQMRGKDVHYAEATEELRADIMRVCRDCMSTEDAVEVADLAVERISEYWEEDEPVHEFDYEGVRGRTTWLGGALLLVIFESPIIGKFRLCSPCVPNCGDLDSPGGDEECYDVPKDWRRSDEY